MILVYNHFENPSAMSISFKDKQALGQRFPVPDIHSRDSHAHMLMQISTNELTETLFMILNN